MKAHFTHLFGAILTILALESQAQDITASLSDDLGIGEVSAMKDSKTAISFNKKVKLTNTENGKSVVVRINDRVKSTENNSLASITKSTMDEIGVKSNKTKVKVQEIQGDDEIERFWATADASTSKSITAAPTAFKKIVKEKEVEVETSKLEGFDINHVYDLNGKIKDLSGFGLQIAAFSQLKAAKDFATKLTKNGEAEIEKIFIQVSKSADKPMVYRVVYGLFEDEANAKDSQKKMENLGYNSFVKGF
ncbi:Endolytic peptidoglycan transglycosylase RlpA [Emticicia aquatica]|jgi:cell division septation protein DedD|uniref:Endolytic peptidoglycan transglycosylase RlpA n=1 Tax=Emticicia aquatica TaxID=1681835 RepID=A0ABM9AN61_9BACT|nr:SPOR domain-containing protein [Emticicia aquatica]CAH0994713.1 Endolytic peptidoglycan transglycosylase RlpA [Emticicia aquatica]